MNLSTFAISVKNGKLIGKTKNVTTASITRLGKGRYSVSVVLEELPKGDELPLNLKDMGVKVKLAQ